jgi:hypothetical protein
MERENVVECHSAIERNNSVSFRGKWMQPKIMLSQISHKQDSERQIACFLSYVKNPLGCKMD